MNTVTFQQADRDIPAIVLYAEITFFSLLSLCECSTKLSADELKTYDYKEYQGQRVYIYSNSCKVIVMRESTNLPPFPWFAYPHTELLSVTYYTRTEC